MLPQPSEESAVAAQVLSATASESRSSGSIVKPYLLLTAITVSANQQRLESGIQPAASFPLFSKRFKRGFARTRLSRSRLKARFVESEAAHSPESWASLVATTCSISESSREANASPV